MENLFQVMPPLSAEEFSELKADIAARGVMVPIEYDEAGVVLDGHHRLKACAELGIEEWPSVVRLGMDAQAKTLHAIKLNCARRHLTTAGKQQAIQKALQAAPEKSDRQLARAIGVAPNTVGAARKGLEATAQIAQLNRTVGADGKERPQQHHKAWSMRFQVARQCTDRRYHSECVFVPRREVWAEIYRMAAGHSEHLVRLRADQGCLFEPSGTTT